LTLHEIDPLHDERWAELVDRHRDGSIFHTPQWLEALRRTYGYEPVALTDAAPGARLNNGLLFCRVNSWMTGRRLVSLPFSDHCEPLVDDPDALASMLASMTTLIGREGRYIELRPLRELSIPAFTASSAFCLHSIDLRPTLEQIFSRFHPSHAQRTIRKAERLGLTCQVGRLPFLAEFYALHALTRRKHGVPIQPFAWFRHLVDELGDRVSIHVAKHQGSPVAAIMTAWHNKTLVYKYGCSDAAFNHYGGTLFLFWRAIQDAKAQGVQEFDLGRSDLSNGGLLAFKDHLGARRIPLTYYRYTGRRRAARTAWKPVLARHAFGLVPKRIQATVGSRLYRHFG
jgi:hypothetical protein